METGLSQKLSRLYASKTFPWIIIGIGITLRLIRYLYNPSLWFDEADIAIDIIRRPIFDLIHPSPDYNQSYPYGFMILVKMSTLVFGNSEFALRLFPLLSGIISLVLFLKVAKYYIKPEAVPIALGLFAILDPLIFESTNLKPYAGDILSTLLIYSITIYIQAKELNLTRTILIGVFGAIILWFSNPSVFVLAGAGICLTVFSLRNKEWSKVRSFLIIYLIWGLSFLSNYFFYIKNLQASFSINVQEMLAVMEHANMPIPPKSISDIKWYTDLFFEIFENPTGITLTGIAALAFLVGSVSIYRQSKFRFLMMASPAAVTLIAAALHEYPFKNRFIFFLVPLILFIIAEGTEYIRSRTVQSAKIIGIIFISLLFFFPLTTSAYRIIKPFYWEDIKPVLKHVKDNRQEGDVLYVNYIAQYQFEYYSKFYPHPYKFDEGEYVIGIAPRGWYRHWRKGDVYKYYGPGAPIKQSSIEIFKIYEKDLDQLKGNKRIWLLFTGAVLKDGINEEKFSIFHLETVGKQMDFFGRSGVSTVYLYDLSRQISNESKL
jgi:hypothetical protein